MTLPGKFSWSLSLILAVGLRGSGADPRRPIDSTKTTVEWLRVLQNVNAPSDDWEKARRALGPGGSRAKDAIPALIDVLGDPREEANDRVVQTLADHGPVVVPDLVRGLKRPESGVRAGSAAALGLVRPRPVGASPALVAALGDPVAAVRRESATALGRVRGPADATVPALGTALKDSDPAVREAAAEALGRFGPRARAAVPALTAALKDTESRVATEAADALARVGPAAAPAVPALVATLRDEKSLIDRERAARALAGIGPRAKEAVPALIAVLRTTQGREQHAVVEALGAIGPDAEAAVPELVKLAANRWFGVLTALGRIGPAAKAAVPVLTEALDNREDTTTRAYAAEALGGIGPDAKAAVPTLMALARDLKSSPLAREAAARAVIKIDPSLAAREGMETAHLNVRAGKVPDVRLLPRPVVTEEQKNRARKLIAQLAEIDSTDFGLSAAGGRPPFAPVGRHASWQMGLLADERQRPSDAFRTLVELGPAALPSLLEALDDRTPTRLTVSNDIAPFGMMGFTTYLPRNPLNRAEVRALARPAPAEKDEDDLLDRYTVKVGDVCLVAVGQIVGRPYLAVRLVPKLMLEIISPVESPAVRERVRAAWGGPDPARRLLDSLLFDYATEGLFNGDSLDGWREGSDFQVEATVRLLYYFPRETAPLIATRLRSFDVKATDRGDGWIKRDVKNGVCVLDFIKAVRWCHEPPIREALADVVKRTDDPEIKKAISAPGE